MFSDLVPDTLGHRPRQPCAEARDQLRLAMEDWATPLVATTNVPLIKSLFAARPSRCPQSAQHRGQRDKGRRRHHLRGDLGAQQIATIRGVTRSHHSRGSDRRKAAVHGDRAELPPLDLPCASVDRAPVAAKERHPLPDPGWQSFLPFSRPTMESPERFKRRRINHDKTNRDEARP